METMKLAIIGLGRMGAALAHRALAARYCVLGYDPGLPAQEEAKKMGIELYDDLAQLAREADIIWLMVPAGKPVDDVLAILTPALKSTAIVVDGGNSLFTDSKRRAIELVIKGIAYLDCGTSGGVHGKQEGFCLMVGGDYTAYEKILPLLTVLAAPSGVAHVGPSGAGHYVKMIHNGIEYGLLQAYAEGFQLLREGDYKDLDLEKISKLWNHGAVVRSWILELCHDIFKHDQMLANIDGAIEENKTGAWTVENAHKNNVPVPVIEKTLEVRAWSRASGGNFATKVVAMLRNAFGGHAVQKK
jgi:6-phosphogluconate dehydrogenase